MTRKKDKSVSLEERCKIANNKKADFFVSIHRNSAKTGNGIEHYPRKTTKYGNSKK